MKLLATDRLAPYRAAIERHICTICNDRDVHGHCARDPQNPCPLMEHLDLVVDSVLSVGGSPLLDDYVASIRLKTCPNCRQDETGHCALREFGECATDSYVLLVVDVIEDVAKELGHGKWARPA